MSFLFALQLRFLHEKQLGFMFFCFVSPSFVMKSIYCKIGDGVAIAGAF